MNREQQVSRKADLYTPVGSKEKVYQTELDRVRLEQTRSDQAKPHRTLTNCWRGDEARCRDTGNEQWQTDEYFHFEFVVFLVNFSLQFFLDLPSGQKNLNDDLNSKCIDYLYLSTPNRLGSPRAVLARQADSAAFQVD